MSAAPDMRYTDRDLRDDESLMPLAVAYVASYTGEFEPLIEAKEMLDEEGKLTIPVARKVLNCMRHDAKVALSLPRPRDRENVVVAFAPPKKRKKVRYDTKQCDDDRSHSYHHWGEENEHSCEGVPFPINRGEVRLPVKVKTAYAASRTGALIHDIDPDGPHQAVWQGPAHEWGYRTSYRSYYDSDADLIVKLRCRFPSFLQKPILIKGADLDRFMQIEDVLMGIRQMKMCPHCAKLRTGS